jgi:hypothetical protein
MSGPSVWMASLDGMAPREVPYERVYAFMVSMPHGQRRRLADGSIVCGAWKFWRRVA